MLDVEHVVFVAHLRLDDADEFLEVRTRQADVDVVIPRDEAAVADGADAGPGQRKVMQMVLLADGHEIHQDLQFHLMDAVQFRLLVKSGFVHVYSLYPFFTHAIACL